MDWDPNVLLPIARIVIEVLIYKGKYFLFWYHLWSRNDTNKFVWGNHILMFAVTREHSVKVFGIKEEWKFKFFWCQVQRLKMYWNEVGSTLLSHSCCRDGDSAESALLEAALWIICCSSFLAAEVFKMCCPPGPPHFLVVPAALHCNILMKCS